MKSFNSNLKGCPRKLNKTKTTWLHPYLFPGITDWAKSNSTYNMVRGLSIDDINNRSLVFGYWEAVDIILEDRYVQRIRIWEETTTFI